MLLFHQSRRSILNKHLFFARGFLVLAWVVIAQVVFHSAPAVAAGNTYYVATNGNDANPGTMTQPWRTIQKAANTAVAGSTVIVNAGTYNETVIESNSGTGPSAMIHFLANGVVTMKAFYIQGNYIELNGFTLTPTDCTWDGAIEVTGNYALIQNNIIQDSTRLGIATSGNTTGATIRGNTIAHVQIMGMDLAGSNHLIENNDISDFRDHFGPCNYGNADGIHFFGQGNTFRGNYIHDFYKADQSGQPHVDAFQTYSDLTNNKPAAKNTLIERNHIFMGNGGKLEEAWNATSTISGFMLEGSSTDKADNIVIQNNVIESWKGLDAGGGVGSNNVSNLKVYNNTFRSDLSFTSTYYPTGMSIHGGTTFGIYNNLLVDFSDLHIFLWDGAQGSYDYNLMWNSNGSMPQVSGYTIQPHDKLGVNPRFVSNFSNLHLQAGSPAIDAGKTIVGVTNDYDNVPRPQGSAYDIGAYEYKPSGGTQGVGGPAKEMLPFISLNVK